jgi:hypothetical protein
MRPVAGELIAPTITWVPREERSWGLAFILTALFNSAGQERKSESAVVAINLRGEDRRLFVTATDDEAAEKAERVRREYDQLGPEAWCERHRVPLDWITPR